MSEAARVIPAAQVREELVSRGAGSLARCYQCATCSSVCTLSYADNPFPRKQMLVAQWGLEDRIQIDPAIWLCHQCTDCSDRCPRDARPADVLQALRSKVVEKLAFPGAVGKLVGKASVTWPLLILAPWFFWLVMIRVTGHMYVPEGDVVYAKFVPHWLIYSVFFPVAGWVLLSAFVSGSRFWKNLAGAEKRKGSFVPAIVGVVMDVALHRNFSTCGTIVLRRWGHFLLFWGFAGAFATTNLLIYVSHVQHKELPLHFWHPIKILGNVSAVLLVVGGIVLAASRFKAHRKSITSSAFDLYFLGVVSLVILSGAGAEVVRFAISPAAAYGLYTVHLGAVMALFLTFPYSKFAHMMYRTLALTHKRMTTPPEGGTS